MLSFFCQKITRYKQGLKLTYIHILKPQHTGVTIKLLSILKSISETNHKVIPFTKSKVGVGCILCTNR